MASASLVSRIAYNSVYGVLGVILGALLLVVPGDFVRQALTTTHQAINLIIIAIVYVLTILIVLFVYVLRLYATRTVLASIPKLWIPIEKGDVDKEVRNMIINSLSESAAIAWEARPKVLAPADVPPVVPGHPAEMGNVHTAQTRESRRSLNPFASRRPATREGTAGTSSSPSPPVWGQVEHDGWGSPASPDLPNLQYATVLTELPNLIEAKAVAQAPPDRDSGPTAPLLDVDAMMLLQRAPNMTMRSYIGHLTELDVLPASQNLVRFLDLYERVRFSGRPMSSASFRRLMHLFAELLRAMRPLHPSLLHDPDDGDSSHSGFDGHIDDDAPNDSSPTTRTPSPSIRSAYSFDRSSTHSHPRVAQLGGRNPSVVTTANRYRTAPTTPRSTAEGTFAGGRSPSNTSSAGSFARTRRPYLASQTSSASLGSLSQTSVIRLATAEDAGGMPYVLRLTDTI
ncbi:hypothetical protein F4802DRAFT_592157 [Xylaria palmicola]|nr:hypothetical protein F4802DRAFT_592157 [Xylaria palmicola]